MLEAQLAGLKKEFATLASDQVALAKHVESVPGQIKRAQEDVSLQYLRVFSPQIVWSCTARQLSCAVWTLLSLALIEIGVA